jgi:hypothetical protein
MRSDGKVVALNQKRTHFSTERGMRIISWVQVFFVQKRIITAVKRDESVSDIVIHDTKRAWGEYLDHGEMQCQEITENCERRS